MVGTKIYLLRRSRINAIAVGLGKRGVQLAFELISFAGFAVWIVEMLPYATHSNYRVFHHPLSLQIFDTSVTGYVGAACVGVGLFIFTAAFVSFGNSWNRLRHGQAR